ncbi:MAG: energy transducer TonB [Spirochaetes bacterium]|nr:energy transducer TonB [Spirochaetota bacterium]MBU1081912.1 energy transducer TonB [Spirochaetota bacterium]
MADNQDEHRADDAWDDTLLPPAPDEDDSESRSDDVTAMEKAGAEFKERLAETLAYPEAARRLGKSGSVGLVVLLEASGRVAGARVAASSGSAILDKAAREAALAVAEVSAPGVALELSLRAVFAAGAASLGP